MFLLVGEYLMLEDFGGQLVNFDQWVVQMYIKLCVCVGSEEEKRREIEEEESECILDFSLGDFLILFSSSIDLGSFRRPRSY